MTNYVPLPMKEEIPIEVGEVAACTKKEMASTPTSDASMILQ